MSLMNVIRLSFNTKDNLLTWKTISKSLVWFPSHYANKRTPSWETSLTFDMLLWYQPCHQSWWCNRFTQNAQPARAMLLKQFPCLLAFLLIPLRNHLTNFTWIDWSTETALNVSMGSSSMWKGPFHIENHDTSMLQILLKSCPLLIWSQEF